MGFLEKIINESYWPVPMHSPFFLMTGSALAVGIFYELAHLAVLTAHRVRITDIVIGYGPRLFTCGIVVFRAWPIGGECLFRSPTPIPLPTWGKTAIAGPVTNLFLALISIGALLAQSDTGYLHAGIVAVLYVNAFFFFINAAAKEESDGLIFWTYLCQWVAGTDLSSRSKELLNAGGFFGVFASTFSFILFEVMRGGLTRVFF
jgi:hypothetical protein